MRIACLILLLLGPAVGSARADDLLPPEKSIEDAIDHYVDARLAKENVAPAPPALAENLVRRTLLDLVGRPPTL